MELRGIGTTRRRRTVGAIPPTRPEYPVKRSVSIGPTVRSRSNFFSHKIQEVVFDGVASNLYDRRRHPVGAISQTGPEQRVKRSVSRDTTVGSRSNIFTSLRRLFSMELRGISTTRRRRTVGAIPPTRLEYPVKRSVSIGPTVGSRSNFFSQDSGGCF